MSKKMKEPFKRVNHKGNIKFPNPLLFQYKERGGTFERMPSLEKPSPIPTTCLKIEITCTCCKVTNTLYL